MTNRREFLRSGAVAAMATPMLFNSCYNTVESVQGKLYERFDKILDEQVINMDRFPDPLIMEEIVLLEYEGNYICRIRTAIGAIGISVANNDKMKELYPIFLRRVAPFFEGKDAREWESLFRDWYVYRSNYKLQNLALWVPYATLEFAVLDLLGKVAGISMGELFGVVHNPEISVYRANNFRGISAEESVELIKEQVKDSNPKALKIKVGGRMSRDFDYPDGRTEKLIPLVRKTFGDEMVLYADSNSSYSVKEAIRIGRILEEYRYDFFEEPVPFDWYEETKMVADELRVPIAGGEQEPSLHTFRWLIANDALDIVQPDIFYFGGMVRSMKVARMAQITGKVCTPHISGSGLGYLYMMHFVSAIENAGPYHEFKGLNRTIPISCETSSLEVTDGRVKVPSGKGLGLTIDPDYIEKHLPVG